MTNILLALAAVFLSTALITDFATAAVIILMVRTHHPPPSTYRRRPPAATTFHLPNPLLISCLSLCLSHASGVEHHAQCGGRAVSLEHLLLRVSQSVVTTHSLTHRPLRKHNWNRSVLLFVDTCHVLVDIGHRDRYGIRINAVSVVNTVMGVGLSVEFVVHIASAFLFTRGRPGSHTTANS